MEELLLLDVEQIVLVCATPESTGPHALARPRLDGRGRVGEYVQASEAATVRDVLQSTRTTGAQLFTIRPAHNPVGPFDFAGGFDDRSDRRLPLDRVDGARLRGRLPPVRRTDRRSERRPGRGSKR